MGRTISGYPILAAMESASSRVLAIPDSGWGIPSLAMISRNRSRSSARSIVAGGVPRILTPAASSSAARLRGV